MQCAPGFEGRAALPNDSAQRLDGNVRLCYNRDMKITVEIPDSDIKEICHFAGERKKGPAIRKLVEAALMMKRRELVAGKFLSGVWGVELKGFEGGRAADQQSDRFGEEAWRG